MTKVRTLKTVALATAALAVASVVAGTDAFARGGGGGGGGGRSMGSIHASVAGGGKFIGGGKFVGGPKLIGHRWHGRRFYGYGYDSCWKYTPYGLVNVCLQPY